MSKKLYSRVIGLFVVLIVSNSSFSQSDNKGFRSENFSMKVETSNNVIAIHKIRSQKVITMKDREEGQRGIVTSFLVSKGIQGIQNLIDNRKKKYTTEYSFAIKDESFYDQISTLGPFDPMGIRFKGFKIARIIKGEDNQEDTAFVARFSIDTTDEKINEIMNNGVFRLTLESFMLKNARVKVPGDSKKLNMDFEISFLSSFISDNGQINADVTIGKFLYSVRNAPIDQNDPSYNEYYENLPRKNPYCIGQSFLIPRSAGYFKNDETKTIEKCYGEGLYSIKVAVKESSKNNFVDKIIIYSSDDIMTVGSAALQKKFGTAPAAAPAKAKTTTPAKAGK